MDMQWRRGINAESVWWTAGVSFIAKKFKSKIRVKAGPGAGGCAVTPPPPPPPPSPSPVERIELPHGPGGGVGHCGHGWSAGLPAAGPAGHRPADIKLGPCKRDKGNYWCGMPVQDG